MRPPNPYPPVVTPAYIQSVIGADERREWWRWHFAGQIAAAILSPLPIGMTVGDNPELRDAISRESVTRADVLIQHLEARS